MFARFVATLKRSTSLYLLTNADFIAGEPPKLDRQKYITLESSFHKLFKNTTLKHLRGIGKTLSSLEVTIIHFALIVQ